MSHASETTSSPSGPEFIPGQRVGHPEYGEGVVVALPRNGYVRAFFSSGEKLVAAAALRNLLTHSDRVLAAVVGTEARLRSAWLAHEAHELPLMESAAALTAAPIDLLPHQVVLTHRIATASPRRFLVADEVGLGKTIETALVLRELASRGELRRALMVVPAGLVNNWHREMNEVFRLNFEVFGSEGDVTDRKSNAFIKHDRLIASVDTLKRPARIKRLLEAPPWDLVVFDEAHHLTAFRNGAKTTKTENYKLAEALKGHSRDLILLSATPHQGDHFRFWMLVQLLHPTLFQSAEDMVKNRHRLNAVVYRRTKADACKPDGSPLFARRGVHTESFTMVDGERTFYTALREYLEDGFALAKRQGNQGRALGFVMTIFQKIAASSFAAVRRTLRRRMMALTLHEAILKDQELDVDGRQRLLDETRAIIHEEYELPHDSVGRGEVERILADLRVKMLRKLNEEELELASDSAAGEHAAAAAEEAAVMAISLALPEERLRIQDLLRVFPEQRETKAEKLLRGLGSLWQQNPQEKIVIFATYLGTVELLEREIERTYPGQGVVVLRGGDHGAKLAAERRFRKADGPRVLVCTAAGREGINLQFARILFNFDLPWNPMDLEQRIGRIHRYGQRHTAQVYNLVLSDTIEGKIFLLLDDKLKEIAKALGKVDEQGNVAEDLRGQILGQLSERLTYDKLYREALSDPELRRTKEELEAALSNATEARKVVFDLFQDLEGFSLDDYQPFADVEPGLERLVEFMRASLEAEGRKLARLDATTLAVVEADGTTSLRLTTDREAARENKNVELLGLDHPLLSAALSRWQELPPEELGVIVEGDDDAGALAWWRIETRGPAGEHRLQVIPVGVGLDGRRSPRLERLGPALFRRRPAAGTLTETERRALLHDHIEPMLERDLQHRGIVPEGGSYSATLIGWTEVQSVGQSNNEILKGALDRTPKTVPNRPDTPARSSASAYLQFGKDVPLSFYLPALGVPKAIRSSGSPASRSGGPAPTDVEFQFRLDGPQVRHGTVVQGSVAALTFFLAPEDPSAMGVLAARALREALKIGGSLGVMLVPFGLALDDEACRKTARIIDGRLDHDIRFALKAGVANEAAGVWVHVDLNGVPLGAFFLAIPVIEDVARAVGAPRKKLWIDLDSVGQPVDALLSISQVGGALFVHCSANGSNNETLFVTQGELKEIGTASLRNTLRGVQQSAKDVANAAIWNKIPDPFDPGLTDGQRNRLTEQTSRVAAAGWRLWSDLRQDTRMCAVLDALGKLPPGSRISVVTDAVFVPWELLYPEDPEDPAGAVIKPGLFWGARYIISTALYEDDWRPSEERRAHADGAASAVLCVDEEVDRDFTDLEPPPAASHARWAEAFARSNDLPIETLAPDDARALLINGTDVAKWIYVFCHIRAGVDGREDELVLAENRVIKPSNLNMKPRFVGRPIVFLNSCGSGAHDPLSLNNFYKGFRRTKQVLGLVVTSFPVPTVTAAAIGRRISGLYLDGSHDLGSALLMVRRDLLGRGIPIGLFYTLNAPGDARAVPSTTSEANNAR